MDASEFKFDLSQGFGEFSELKLKKAKEGKPESYTLIVDKMKSQLTINLEHDQYQALLLLRTKGDLRDKPYQGYDTTILEYLVKVAPQSDAVHIANQDKPDWNFIGTGYGNPWLEDYRVLPPVKIDQSKRKKLSTNP